MTSQLLGFVRNTSENAKGAVQIRMTVLKMQITCKQKCDQNVCELWITECALLCFQSWNNEFSIQVAYRTQIVYTIKCTESLKYVCHILEHVKTHIYTSSAQPASVWKFDANHWSFKTEMRVWSQIRTLCFKMIFQSLDMWSLSQVFDIPWSLNEDSNIGNAILFSMIIPNTFKGTVSKCVPKLQLHFVFYWMCVHFEWYSNCNPNCIVEVMGLNPVGASEYFLGFICNCF